MRLVVPLALAAAGTLTTASMSTRTDAPHRPSTSVHAPDAAPTLAVPNDNRTAGGRRAGAALELRLVAQVAGWRPDADVDSAVTVQAWAEEGGPPRIPGPLVRATTGTEVRVTVRNAVPDSVLVVHGLRAGTVKDAADDTVHVAPGATREVRFTAGAPGTYMYWGSTTGVAGPRFTSSDRDAQLVGALVVDSVGTRPDPRERIFVLSLIEIGPDTVRGTKEDIWEAAINGRSWPHTERLLTTVGDSVRWRFINATERSHPMHLHGFHFRVRAKGNGYADTTYAPGRDRLAVTEYMPAGSTFRMEWVPTRAGNWLFHCHMAAHITPYPQRPDSAHAHDVHDVARHPLQGMAGLVLGIRTDERRALLGWVRPASRETRAARAADARSVASYSSPERPAQRLRLYAQELPVDSGNPPRRGFVLQQGAVPRADSVQVPGPPLVLTRGETTVITVVNRLAEATTVHWHGMELLSLYDGVAGWSGARSNMAPLLAPGDSFTVAFTPPRAGTYMYHTHMDERDQLRSGMYGPLIVLEPGERRDPATDHVVMIGRATEGDRNRTVVNGRREPVPLELRAGVAHRFRLVSMLPNGPVLTRLTVDSMPVAWTPVGKDGAALPPALMRPQPAAQVIGVGETYDFTWMPPGPVDAFLEVWFSRAGPPVRLPVRVRPALAGR